jgi:hypothetical protein
VAFYRPANVSQDRVVAAMTALVTRSLASEP